MPLSASGPFRDLKISLSFGNGLDEMKPILVCHYNQNLKYRTNKSQIQIPAKTLYLLYRWERAEHELDISFYYKCR